MALDTLQQQRLSDAHRTAQTNIRARAEAHVADRWMRIGSYRDGDIERFAAEVAPVVLGAQQQVSAVTVSYLTTVAAAEVGRGRTTAVDPATVTGARVRNGVPPAEVYRRPGVTVWRELEKGAALAVAVERGAKRALKAVATDLQLTRTHTSRAVLSSDARVTGYVRIPKGAETCAMCLIASTQRYRRSDLMPIHPGCDCEVGPLYGSTKHVQDPELLTQVHAAVERDFGISDAGGRDVDYRSLIATREHGEYGPVLTVRRHRHTGPADLN